MLHLHLHASLSISSMKRYLHSKSNYQKRNYGITRAREEKEESKREKYLLCIQRITSSDKYRPVWNVAIVNITDT